MIVRSNGTVGYVGKDIAYHIWKFGLLGAILAIASSITIPGRECWISADAGRRSSPLRRCHRNL